MACYYEVQLTRRVALPFYGPNAYRLDTTRKEFPFGKDKEFASGKNARVAAETFAKGMLENASSVSVWRMSNSGGSGVYLKDDMNSRFMVPWSEKLAAG